MSERARIARWRSELVVHTVQSRETHESESDRIARWRSELAVHTMSERAPAASPNRSFTLDDDKDTTVRLTMPSQTEHQFLLGPRLKVTRKTAQHRVLRRPAGNQSRPHQG